MLDLRRIRTEPEAVAAALDRRGPGASEALERILAVDAEQRRITGERDELRSQVKALSKQVGRLRGQGKVDEAQALMDESRKLGEDEEALATAATVMGDEIRDLLLAVPNLPSDDAPDGAGEADNVVLRTEGYDPGAYGEHQRVPHWDIGDHLGLFDFARATKISGSMFTMYRGWGARLLRALVQLSLDRNADAYEEVRPPTLVLTETMVSTGHLPKFADDAYHVERDDLWAIPTAEVPLTSLHRDEILDEADLPAALHGVHVVLPARGRLGGEGHAWPAAGPRVRQGRAAGRSGRRRAGHRLPGGRPRPQRGPAPRPRPGLPGARPVHRRPRQLGRPHVGHRGLRPGCDQWLEVSSVSWFADYQARRANIRFRPAPDATDGDPGGKAKPKGTVVAHTVNGSAMGWPRTVAAYLETHRRPDGSVAIVDVLRPYLGGAEAITPRA